MESKKIRQYFQRARIHLHGVHEVLLIVYLFLILSIQTFLACEGKGAAGVLLSLVLCLAVLGLVCPVLLRKAGAFRVYLWENRISGKEKLLWVSAFFFGALVILLHWYLAYYPGAFTTDAVYQYKQAVSGRYNDWKPILQTLFTYTLPLKLTGRPEAIVLFQILEYSGVLAWLGYVIRKYSNPWLASAVLLYILLNPVTGNIAVCPWKDVTFAMSAVLLMTFGLQIHISDGKWLDSGRRVFLLGILLAAATIVRHNGFLFTVPFLAAVLVRIGKRRRIGLLLIFVISAGVVKGPVRMGLEVPESWNHTARVMGLPMSMLGNIAKESPESFDEETEEFMYAVASPKEWEEKYVCGNFNSIKWQCNQSAIEEAGAAKIIRMTVKSSFKAPGPALRGLFELTDIVYTITGELDWNLKPSMDENNVGLKFQEKYDQDAVEAYTDFSRTGIFKFMFWYVGVLNLAVIFSILCKCRFRVKGDWKKLLFALPLLCYNFGTMLLLPGNDFRYFYLAFPICPLILLILFGETGERPDKEARKKRADVRSILRKIHGKLAALPKTGRMYALFVFMLSSTVILGGRLNVMEAPYVHRLFIVDGLWMGLLCVILFFTGKVLITGINGHLREVERAEGQKRWWLVAFLALVILWIPYLAAYYPGVVTEDSLVSLQQAKDLFLLYNHIPVAYTLLIAAFARIGWVIGDGNFGVFLFTFVQLLLMAAILSYSIYWVRTRISKNRVVTCALLFFYGVNPVIALYAVTMWKDVLFSAWILLFCLFLSDVGMSRGQILEGRKGLLQLVSLFVLVSFGRNNGIYVVILNWAVLLLCCKTVRKKLLAAGGGMILLILLVQGPGYKALGIDQTGFAESVGIPIQQVSYTVVRDGPLDEKEEEFLEKIIPIRTIEENYSPISADNIKFHSEFDTGFFEAHKAEFIKLYLKLMPFHLSAYVESYLLSTVGFWHIEPIGWLGSEGVSENEMGIYSMDYLKEWFHLDGKERLTAAMNSMRRWPVTNVGLLVWLVFFYMMLSLMQKESWKVLTALPLIGCWLTIMIATPVCSQFRYVYYYHLMLPIICILLFIKRKDAPEA